MEAIGYMYRVFRECEVSPRVPNSRNRNPQIQPIHDKVDVSYTSMSEAKCKLY